MNDDSYFRTNPVSGTHYDPMKQARYTEIATFMRAPLASSLEQVDIGLIGVPTDLGVTNRPGARHGPREIRNSSSLMRAFNVGLGMNPVALYAIADRLAQAEGRWTRFDRSGWRQWFYRDPARSTDQVL